MGASVGGVDLVQNGKVRFALHRLPWQSAEDILEPADELIRAMEQSLGLPVPNARGGLADDHPVALVLHRDIRSELEREAFEVLSIEDRVELRSPTVEGIFHAVYWFLEKALGARWLWPGSTGEVIPKHSDLAFPIGRWTESPDYAWRAIALGGAVDKAADVKTMLHARLRLPLEYQQAFDLWCRRNRFGGVKVAGGHKWAEIAPPEEFGESHPEYFALVDGERQTRPGDGKHGNQPCLTELGVAELIADYTRARLKVDRDLDVLSVALNDGGRACECDRCRAFDEEIGEQAALKQDRMDRETEEEAGGLPRSITDQLFYNLQKVVELAGDALEDKHLLTHLYSYYRRAPLKYSLPEEVIGQYCVVAATFWDEEAKKIRYDELRAVAEHVPSLGIYEYLIQTAWPDLIRLYPELLAETVRFYHDTGARYYATQPSTGFASNGLNLWLLGRCLWDVGTDSDAATEEFCEAGFGPAAPDVRRYLDAFADRWRETRSGETVIDDPHKWAGFARLYPEAFLAARAEELAAAAVAAGDDEEVQARVAFVKKGLEHTQAYCVACESTARLLEMAGEELPLSIDPVSASDSVREAAAVADDAWKAYWSFVDAHMGQFVFAEFWVHYRLTQYGEDRVLEHIGKIARG